MFEIEDIIYSTALYNIQKQQIRKLKYEKNCLETSIALFGTTKITKYQESIKSGTVNSNTILNQVRKYEQDLKRIKDIDIDINKLSELSSKLYDDEIKEYIDIVLTADNDSKLKKQIGILYYLFFTKTKLTGEDIAEKLNSTREHINKMKTELLINYNNTYNEIKKLWDITKISQ